ncbi:hypothetical protein [Calothrix sp. NIES-2100]|uniref:hypothetical protein n=1 Tax=Calothrix sp. NIES-2100 TaxID=1954172 RepID=UPI0030D9FDA0
MENFRQPLVAIGESERPLRAILNQSFCVLPNSNSPRSPSKLWKPQEVRLLNNLF